MDFKVSYLDAGLTNSYFSDSDSLTGSVMTPTLPSQPTSQRVNRRYKTQLRDFLSTCRNKRTKLTAQSSVSPPATPTVASVDYLAADTSAAAAVAAAYSNLNTMYPTAYAPTAVAASTDPSLTTYIGHTGNYHQTLYPATALDNRWDFSNIYISNREARRAENKRYSSTNPGTLPQRRKTYSNTGLWAPIIQSTIPAQRTTVSSTSRYLLTRRIN